MPLPLRPTNWPIKLQWKPLVGQNVPASSDRPFNGYLRIQIVRAPTTSLVKTHYRLSAPAVVAQPQLDPVSAGPLGAFAAPTPRIRTHYKLSAPAVVNPASPPLTAHQRTVAAQPPQTRTRSKLSPPAVVNQLAQPPVDAEIHRHLAEQPPRVRRTISVLRGPMAVLPAPAPPVEAKLHTHLSAFPWNVRSNGWGLAPPAIVELPPAEAKLHVHLAERRVPRSTHFRLTPPTVFATPTAGFLPRPLRPTLARIDRAHPVFARPFTALREPVAVGPFVPPTPEPGTELQPRVYHRPRYRR